MKKLLSLVLVLAVVLSSMSFAFAAAPSDLGDYKYADAVKKLVGLGIINGYPDGTFKPTGNITRAEYAKVVVTALGYSDAAVAAGDAKFSDMTGHWAVGYVNVASSLGIINGVGAGKFAPDANVKYEEAVTMIVRALGYEPAAKSNGGYPNGYLAIASQKKITKDVAMVAGNIADRGTVAKLMAESLEVNFLEQTGYGTLTTYTENASKNLLATGLKLTKAPGITIDSYDTTAKTIKFTSDVDKKRQMSYVDPIDPTNSKNCKVDFWYKDGVIYSFKNETTVKVDQIKKVNDSDSVTQTGTTFTASGSFTLENDGGLYYTDDTTTTAVEQPDVKINDGSITSFGQLIGKMAKVYIKDNKIYKVEAFNMAVKNVKGLVTEATAKQIKYQTFDDNDGMISNISGADLNYVFIDGVQKSLADLKAGTYFEYWATSDTKKIAVFATTATATGKLTAYSNDHVTVAGTSIETATGINNNNASTDKYVSLNNGTKYEDRSVDGLKDKDVVAYKNLVGKIAFVKGTGTAATTDFYGLVKKVKNESETITVLKDVSGVSTEVDYAVKTDDVDSATGGITWANFKIATVGGANNTGAATGATAATRVFKFFINSDNKVTKIQQLTFTATADAPSGGLNKDTNQITLGAPVSASYYADGAKFFNLNANSVGGTQFKNIKVMYWNTVKGSTLSANSDNFAVALDSANGGTNTTKANVVVCLDDLTTVVGDKYYALVTAQEMIGDFYYITTPVNSGDSRLKLHKDDAQAAMKQMDKSFIAYNVEGDRIKVKTVEGVVYNATTWIDDVPAYDPDALLAASATGTVTAKDGSEYITATGINGGNAVKLASDVKVAVVVLKDLTSTPAVDTVTESTVASIAVSDKIITYTDGNGLVKAIFYYRP